MILDTFSPEFPRRTATIHVKKNRFYRRRLPGDALPYGILFVTVGVDMMVTGLTIDRGGATWGITAPWRKKGTGFYITRRSLQYKGGRGIERCEISQNFDRDRIV
jgi:hypothetical protein